MMSERKLEANRRNAQKSTGPRTAEGKARSARNSTIHGMFSRGLVCDGENEREFNALREALIDELRPQNTMELILVQRIVANQWKLLRLQLAEHSELRWLQLRSTQKRTASTVLGAWIGQPDSSLHRLSTYEQRLERGIIRARRELERLRENAAEVSALPPSPFSSSPPEPPSPQVDEPAQNKNVRNEPTEVAESCGKTAAPVVANPVQLPPNPPLTNLRRCPSPEGKHHATHDHQADV